jgi:hypothetical protein
MERSMGMTGLHALEVAARRGMIHPEVLRSSPKVTLHFAGATTAAEGNSNYEVTGCCILRRCSHVDSPGGGLRVT